MEKELDLLIATEMSGDGDSVAEELRSVFAKRGVTVHRIEFRSGKDSVIRSVRANPQIHAVVLSQYQDQEKLCLLYTSSFTDELIDEMLYGGLQNG